MSQHVSRGNTLKSYKGYGVLIGHKVNLYDFSDLIKSLLKQRKEGTLYIRFEWKPTCKF